MPLKIVQLLCTLIFILGLQGISQTANKSNTGDISGKIINANFEDVVYASIMLLQNDSTLVNSTISDTNGTYKFSKVTSGAYKLIIDHMEYERYTSDTFIISDEAPIVIKNMTLNVAENTLDEVVITQKKAIIEIKPDKLIFNVASSPSASGTNGLELLKKSPGVTLDLNNNIALLGKGNVQVYLNGIQSRLSGDDLTNFLQSLTSDIIDSIEIISNPPAKYDAEGSGGIINIRMKKNVSTGFNGSATSSFTKGEEYRYSNNLTLNYGSEKIKTNLDLTQSYDNYLEFFNHEQQQNNSILYLSSKENAIRKGFNLGLGMDAQLSDKHLISFSARSIFNSNDNELYSTTDIYTAEPREFTQILLSDSYRDGKSQNHILNLNHHWNTSEKSTLVTNFSLGIYDTENNTLQPNTYFEPDGTTEISKEDASFSADTKINLWSAKVDYDKEWESVTFSTGVKYAQIETENDFSFFDIANDQPIRNPNKSNFFNYTENVAAIYANISTKLGSTLNLNAGLRVENTASRGQLISEIEVDNKDVTRNYTDFFPNFGLSFDNDSKHGLSLNIGRRITRPNYQDLNPFEYPNSQLVIWKGNPFLKPNYITNYQLSYAYDKRLILTPFYSHTKDFFSRIVEVVDETSTQIIPRNVQNSYNYGISMSYTLNIAKYWEAIIFANVSEQSFKGNVEEVVIDIKAILWDYRIQNNINLPYDILLDVTFSQRSDWIWRGSSFIEGTYSLDFGIRKNFLDDKLQLRITGSDILRTSTDYPYSLNYGGQNLNGVYTNDNRRFGLGLLFKFGNQKAKTKRRTNSALDDELNRIN